MLYATTNFNSALSATNRKFDIMVKVYRNTSGSVNPAIDISDRVISYQCSQDFDSRSGRLSLEIDNYDYLLSPLNRDSSYNKVGGVYDPLFDSNHKVELYEGLQLNDGSFEYIKKFEGYMGDEISASTDPSITLSLRDKSKLLQDTYIYQGPSYSMMLVEDVIKDLLKTFVPSLGINFTVQDPTQYVIGRPDGAYTPKDTNLWDAIQLLADSASQELRFTEQGILIMRKIVRDFSAEPVNLSLTLANLISDSMEISDADVRNHIVVKVQGFDPITKKDDYSIAKYGRRYMEVQRGMSDLITDVSQAHELATNILMDLRFANPIETAELPLHPLIQVGDIVQIDNQRLGTNSVDDIFKVTSVTNEYSKDKKRTRLELQGFDKFLDDTIPSPRPATSLTYLMQKRTIQNYPNSGWFGYQKETSFPMLKWNPPTLDMSGNALSTNWGGYVIERATQISGSSIGTTWMWGTVASIPSYIAPLDKKVDYFYDYSCSAVLARYKKYGSSSSTVTLKYRVTAINEKGNKSLASNEISVPIPIDKFKDSNGNYI